MDGEAETTSWEFGPQTPVQVADDAPGADWRKHALGLVVALVIALGVRLWWHFAVNTQPVTDFDWYFERAKGIVHGLGYSVDGDQTAYWPVGYPLILALFFKVFGVSVVVGKALNTALTLTAIGLSWRLAFGLFRDHRVATFAALILAVHPAYVAYSGILASEPLFTCLTLYGIAGCLFYPRSFRNWITASGAALGLSVLVRPQAVLLPLIVCLCRRWDAKPVVRGQALKAFALVSITMALVLVPWTLRNQMVFGQTVFVSTNGGDNLLIGNSAKADGRYHNPNELGYDLAAFGEVDRDKFATKSAIQYMRGHLRKTVSIWPAKLSGTFLSGTDAPYWAFQKEKGHMVSPGMGADKAFFKSFRTYSEAFTVWLLGFAAAGVVLAILGRRRTRLPLTGLALIGYSAVVSLVFFGNPRFAFPIVPFLAMHACHGLIVLWDGLRATRLKPKDGLQPEVADRPSTPA